jgi:ribosomal-protein-alanine N-acetyltransferase
MKISAKGFRVYIKPPVAADEEAFLTTMRTSVGLHHPWITAPRNHKSWKRYMSRLTQENELGFLVRRLDDDEICGVANLNVITYQALCSAYTSYFGVAGLVEKGYMKEGMQLMIRYAFRELGLHRLEANIQPKNLASIALVQSVGFQYEGFSPRYLKINGEWRDHERWCILADAADYPL